MSLKSRLLSLTADRHEGVDIPGAGTVYIHAMSEIERAHFEAIAQEQKNQKQIKRLLIVLTARESDTKAGALLFSSKDINAMGEMDSAVVDKLATTAMAVCGIGEVDLGALLKKPEADSKPTTVGSSDGHSDSPSTSAA